MSEGWVESGVVVRLLNPSPLAVVVSRPQRPEDYTFPKRVRMPKTLKRKLGRLIRRGLLPKRRYELMA